MGVTLGFCMEESFGGECLTGYLFRFHLHLDRRG